MAGPVAGDATSAHAVPARLPPRAPVLERDQGERHMPDENDRRQIEVDLAAGDGPGRSVDIASATGRTTQ